MPGNGETPISRKEIREAIATGLSGTCTAAAAVYPYGKSDFGAAWPTVRVMSRGSQRPPMTGHGIRSGFQFLVDVWVLYKGDGWTEQNAEDALDTIEQQVITWLTENQGGELWTSIAYTLPSQVDVVSIAGEPWLTEAIQITAEVYG